MSEGVVTEGGQRRLLLERLEEPFALEFDESEGRLSDAQGNLNRLMERILEHTEEGKVDQVPTFFQLSQLVHLDIQLYLDENGERNAKFEELRDGYNEAIEYLNKHGLPISPRAVEIA